MHGALGHGIGIADREVEIQLRVILLRRICRQAERVGDGGSVRGRHFRGGVGALGVREVAALMNQHRRPHVGIRIGKVLSDGDHAASRESSQGRSGFVGIVGIAHHPGGPRAEYPHNGFIEFDDFVDWVGGLMN